MMPETAQRQPAKERRMQSETGRAMSHRRQDFMLLEVRAEFEVSCIRWNAREGSEQCPETGEEEELEKLEKLEGGSERRSLARRSRGPRRTWTTSAEMPVVIPCSVHPASQQSLSPT
jgi:hypothetical protein